MLERVWRNCWWQCKLVKSLWRTVCGFLQKLNIELPYDPAISLWGIYLEKIIVQKDTCNTIFRLPYWLSQKKICLPMQKMCIQSLGREDSLEKEMGTHSSILAWGIPLTKEPGALQSMGSQKSQAQLSN